MKKYRPKAAIECLEAMRDGAEYKTEIVLPVDLIKRGSTRKKLGKILLIVFALYAPVKVENMILGGGIIRSGGNTRIIMIIDIVGTWCIGIPLCLLAAYVFKWGIGGVYTSLTTEELFRLAVSLIIFRKRKWINSFC